MRYHLAVSNPVFHNMGKKRFNAYTTAFDALKPKGFFVLGDLFPHEKADARYFRECSTLVNASDESGFEPWPYRIQNIAGSVGRLQNPSNYPGSGLGGIAFIYLQQILSTYASAGAAGVQNLLVCTFSGPPFRPVPVYPPVPLPANNPGLQICPQALVGTWTA